ncbi:hypothetical protein BN1110_02561 [bacterium YEK0313]|nr:hypothetical protein BN1110_02561 [bacterium YEK0313]
MTLHYVAGGGIESNGTYSAGSFGFNLADVQSVEQLNSLPEGTKGLVWLDKAEGVTSDFINTVYQYIGNDKLFGFYLADEPDPTGLWGPEVSAADLKAESDWIHANVPGAKTFIVMMNMGMTTNPSYMDTYNPANTGIDYYGLDPYPVRSGGQLDLSAIDKNVDAAIKAGIPLSSIVPVYQAFGGGGWSTDTGDAYVMPTSTQMKAMIDHWAGVVPNPAFDYAYHWESQNGDQALSTHAGLLDVFREHNAGTATPTAPAVTEPATPPTDAGGVDTGALPTAPHPTDPDAGSTAGSGNGGTPAVSEPTAPASATGDGGRRGHWDHGGRPDWAGGGQKFAQKFAAVDAFRFADAGSGASDAMSRADSASLVGKVGASGQFAFLENRDGSRFFADAGAGADVSGQGHADVSSPVGKTPGNHHSAWDHLWG